jgi:hypothetical protein
VPMSMAVRLHKLQDMTMAIRAVGSRASDSWTKRKVDSGVSADAVLDPGSRSRAAVVRCAVADAGERGLAVGCPVPVLRGAGNLVLRVRAAARDSAVPRPTVRPGTVVIDRGRNYQSVAFMARCEYLRINVQPARPYRGSDWLSRSVRSVTATIVGFPKRVSRRSLFTRNAIV